MEKEPNQHLATLELTKLLEEARQRGDSALSAAAVHPHLAVCPMCREQFEGLAELDVELRNMQAGEPAAQESDCPGAEVWSEIAGGLTEQDQTLIYIEHASRCDHCGPLLRAAMMEVAGLNEELTNAEREQIVGLESARPEWQVRLAERISGRLRPSPGLSWRERWFSVPRFAAAGVAIALVTAIGFYIVVDRVFARTPGAADQLLARAYTDKRTLELRIPGAAYGPLRVQMGPAEGFAARPAALLKAEALIASQMASHPDDPEWLQAAGRADLLEGKYDAAVESLQRALELRPDSPELLLDLGTAHFQRAQSEDRQEDYGAAFEYLSKALTLQPENTTALFNRAIVAEHQFLYRQALEDWEHYLKMDPTSQWAEEARNHAETVRTKLKEHGRARPLLPPAEVGPAVIDKEVDQRVEEYLGEAIRKWLPEAFPESATREADASAQRALFLLADLTSRQHDDRWLADLLRGASAPQFRQAVAALARSASANDAGDYGASAEQAVHAEQLFRAGGNTAGALRARFEQVFSAQLSRRIGECRAGASRALTESGQQLYPWLQAQFELEEELCAKLDGDPHASGRNTTQALDRAQKSGYGAVYLRAVGFVVDDDFGAGNSPEAWKLITTGLERYWTGEFTALRGYSLYNILASYVDAAKEPNLRVSLWYEAVTLIDSDQDLAMRAGAHSSLANAAASAHQLRLAQDHYAEAARLFALAPRTGASVSSALENEIRVAQLEARQGHFDAAVERLTRNQNLIRQLSDTYLHEIFYSALGEVQLRTHQPSDAEQSLRLALALAEKKRASLNSEAERILWSQDAAPLYLAMSEAELDEGRAQDSLAVYERYLGAAQWEGGQSGAGARAGEPDATWLGSRLPLLSGKTVIAYGVLPDGLAIWTYDNRGVSVQWLPGVPHDLPNMGQRFYESCSDPNSDLSAIRRDAQSLYAALVAPIENRLEPGRALVIEANGWAARVPFEALVDPAGHALIERWPIVHSLGQYSDARMRSIGAISPVRRALVVGSTASSQSRDLVPLPNVTAEAEMVASGFQWAEVLKGQNATLSAVTDKLPSAEIFHFTGHSLSTPQHAGLLVAGGDDSARTPLLLDADRLRRLDLQRLQLAVLSTCSSRSGRDESRGFTSVAEAFERSGVPHVVASRWAVDSMETRRLMEMFYRSLLSGQTVSNALRSAAQQLLSDPRTAHPYFWAAFAAYGQP
ncbi:MAG: CHAT domain-containing protein [Terriglobales bacterium]